MLTMRDNLNFQGEVTRHIYLSQIEYTGVGRVDQSVWRLTMGWTVRDRIVPYHLAIGSCTLYYGCSTVIFVTKASAKTAEGLYPWPQSNWKP